MSYIFLHGLGQNNSSWNNVIKDLYLDNNICCPNLFDIRNEANINYFTIYNDFCKYCESLDTPINICGLSLGGILAINYTIENPEKVKSLVLIGTQYKMPKILMNIQYLVFKLCNQKFFDKINIKKNDCIEIFKSVKNLDFSKELDKILCPTLIICGEKDTFNKKASKDLENLIKNSQVKFIEKTGHIVNEQSPVELSKILNEFYKNLD